MNEKCVKKSARYSGVENGYYWWIDGAVRKGS